MSNDNKLRLKLIRELPSWTPWAISAVVVAGLWLFLLGSSWVVWPLGGAALVLGCANYLAYNAFAFLYNRNQLNNLAAQKIVDELIKGLDGTSESDDGLSIDKEELDDER